MKTRIVAASLCLITCTALGIAAHPMVGGAKMSPNKNIAENLATSKDHTTLVAALKAAELMATLKGAGPFTVFAPTNEAFAKLPAGTMNNLLKPENKDALVNLLTYHVVPGRVTLAMLKQQMKQGKGTGTLRTVSGGTLTFIIEGGKIKVKDEKGDVANITIPNITQSNGVIHVIDTVMLPDQT